MIRKIFGYSFIFILVVFAFITILFLQKYNVFIMHDYSDISHNRNFFNPQYGRYLATYINNIITDRMPDFFNIHPNDFNPAVMVPIKAVFIILMCFLYTHVGFIFSKKSFWDKLCNPAFSVFFLLIFLTLFNENYLFVGRRIYLCTFENTVFFEYPMSLLFFIPLISYLCYYYVNKTIPTKANYLILLLLALCLGETVQIVSIQSFILLTIFLIILLRKYLKNKDENKIVFKLFIGIYCAVFISLVISTLDFQDFTKDFGESTYLNYVITEFPAFIKMYYNDYILHHSYLLIPTIIILTAMFFINRNSKQFIGFMSICIFALLFFYLLTFFIAGSDGMSSGYFPIMYNKWECIYKMICLLYLILTFSYLTDNILKINDKYSSFIKIIICIIVLIIFRNNMVTGYYPHLLEIKERYRQIRVMMYKAEKMALTQNMDDDIIHLSQEYKDPWTELVGCSAFYVFYINDLYKMNKTDCDFNLKNEDMDILTNEELKELKFQKLLENHNLKKQLKK